MGGQASDGHNQFFKEACKKIFAIRDYDCIVLKLLIERCKSNYSLMVVT